MLRVPTFYDLIVVVQVKAVDDHRHAAITITGVGPSAMTF